MDYNFDMIDDPKNIYFANTCYCIISDCCSQVFTVVWFWHCVLILCGVLRIVLRLVQLCSACSRLALLKMQMDRYLANNKHARHIEHYVTYCSIGDWFLLYQMNKSMNKRFFAEFLALLSLKVIINDMCLLYRIYSHRLTLTQTSPMTLRLIFSRLKNLLLMETLKITTMRMN